MLFIIYLSKFKKNSVVFKYCKFKKRCLFSIQTTFNVSNYSVFYVNNGINGYIPNYPIKISK